MNNIEYHKVNHIEQKQKPYGIVFVVSNFIIVLCTVLFLFFIGFSTVYIGVPVIGESMQNTLNEKGGNLSDTVFINRFAAYEVNDIIVIKEEGATHEYIIKRLIAVAGDRVNFVMHAGTEDVDLVINGEIVTENYLYDFTQSGLRYGPGMVKAFENFVALKTEYFQTPLFNSAGELVVPHGQLFVLGDNRGNSLDSSTKGPFLISQVVGKIDHVVKYGDSVVKYFLNYFTPFTFA